MKCMGCGGEIPWDGKGLFAYTCPCGSTTFYDERGIIAPPSSLIIALGKGKGLAHIDYYVGISSHESEIKKQFVEMLRKHGAVWSWECDECREKFLGRKRMEKENGLLRVDLHPDLRETLGG